MELETKNYQFASDNYAGAHDAILQKLHEVNKNNVPAYGYDTYTQQTEQLFKKHFGPHAMAFLVGTGGSANVLGLKAVLQSFHGVICTTCAHIHTDECGAFENTVGGKLLLAPTHHGKLTPQSISAIVANVRDEHQTQPKAVSITQATELGTVYSIDELKAICKTAHQHNLLVHMDGARLANAAAFLNVSLREITYDVGIDILSFGGTKNGALMAEAVVFFNPEHAENFKFIRKQHMFLFSKMRFLAAQFIALFENNLWYNNAQHANAMAQMLATNVTAIPKLSLAFPTQANEIFINMPITVRNALVKKYHAYTWTEDQVSNTCIVRFVTSFATNSQDIEALATYLKSI